MIDYMADNSEETMDSFDGEKSEGETPKVVEEGKVDRSEVKNEGETPKE